MNSRWEVWICRTHEKMNIVHKRRKNEQLWHFWLIMAQISFFIRQSNSYTVCWIQSVHLSSHCSCPFYRLWIDISMNHDHPFFYSHVPLTVQLPALCKIFCFWSWYNSNIIHSLSGPYQGVFHAPVLFLSNDPSHEMINGKEAVIHLKEGLIGWWGSSIFLSTYMQVDGPPRKRYRSEPFIRIWVKIDK